MKRPLPRTFPLRQFVKSFRAGPMCRSSLRMRPISPVHATHSGCCDLAKLTQFRLLLARDTCPKTIPSVPIDAAWHQERVAADIARSSRLLTALATE
jgi:hypothetical protein